MDYADLLSKRYFSAANGAYCGKLAGKSRALTE